MIDLYGLFILVTVAAILGGVAGFCLEAWLWGLDDTVAAALDWLRARDLISDQLRGFAFPKERGKHGRR